MWLTLLSFVLVMIFVSWLGNRLMGTENNTTRDGYFLGGRSLTGIVIAGSLIMTNISTEHLVGMNASAYKNGALVITWEVTSAIALVLAALFFAPSYLKLGLTTIPELLEKDLMPGPEVGLTAYSLFLSPLLCCPLFCTREPSILNICLTYPIYYM